MSDQTQTQPEISLTESGAALIAEAQRLLDSGAVATFAEGLRLAARQRDAERLLDARLRAFGRGAL